MVEIVTVKSAYCLTLRRSFTWKLLCFTNHAL